MRAVVMTCGQERVGVRISPTNTHHEMHDADPEALFFTAVTGLNEIAPAICTWLKAPPRRARRNIRSTIAN
jgi:hypothetical protein